MTQRILSSLGVAAVTIAVMLLLQLSPVPVAGQASAQSTAWGHPDLQGIWLYEFQTPLERSPQAGDKEFFTDEERTQQDAARSGSAGRNERAQTGSQADVAGAYNAVFTSAKRAGRRTSLVVDPPNGRIPALTPAAQEDIDVRRRFRMALLQNTETCKNEQAGCNGWEYGPPAAERDQVAPFYNTGRMSRHDGPEDQSMGDRCMLGTTPDLNGHRRIVQGPDSIAIAYDTGQGQGFQRIVYLGGSHPPSSVHLTHGDSRGHWEGTTLVIETTNFSPAHPFRGAAENLKLVERYSRTASGLEYTVTITDPTVWAAPWTVKQELNAQDAVQNRIYYEPRCHEGNYGLPALLIGARMDEKAFAEGRGPDPASVDTASCVGGLN
jgi:hypothetical protein